MLLHRVPGADEEQYKIESAVILNRVVGLLHTHGYRDCHDEYVGTGFQRAGNTGSDCVSSEFYRRPGLHFNSMLG